MMYRKKTTGKFVFGAIVFLALGVCRKASGQSGGKRDVAGPSSVPAALPGFKKIAEVSGVDVIVRDRPARLPAADGQLKILFSRGAEAFRRELKKTLGRRLSPGANQAALKGQLKFPAEILALSRYEALRYFGAEAFDTVRARREGEAFLTEFLGGREWLDDCLTARWGDRDRGPKFLHALCSIYRYDKECTLPLYRKLACAYAYGIGGDWEQDTFHHRVVEHFQAHKNGHKEGLLHGSFDRLESWEMVFCVCDDGFWAGRYMDNHLKHVHYPRRSYSGACWLISYLSYNVFGDSVQTSLYYRPWMDFGEGFVMMRRVGGVCGALSKYGSFLARAHGIPSFTVGQPGHCAYMLRPGDDVWTTAFNVTGNTKANSFFGRGDESIVRLMQAAYDNRNRGRLIRSLRHDWQARFLKERTGNVFSPAEKTARHLSLEANPLHLGLWNDYARRMKEVRRTSPAEWKNLSSAFISAAGAWRRPCWEYLSGWILPELAGLPAKELRRVVLGWHKAMPSEGEIHRIGRRLADHLDRQTQGMKAPRDKARFFSDLLDIYSERPEFIHVVAWGQSALAQKKETAPLFLSALTSYRAHPGRKIADISSILGSIVLTAEKNGDFKTLEMASELARSLYPRLFNKIYRASEAALEKIPEPAAAPPGRLLSSRAVPRLSDPGDAHSALGHYAALQDGRVGLLATRKGKDPSIGLDLPGRCRITGLVLIGCFENKKWADGHHPLLVETSLDGKTWKRLGAIRKPKAMHRYDFSRAPAEAGHIRFSFEDKESERAMCFRAVRVYGTPLY